MDARRTRAITKVSCACLGLVALLGLGWTAPALAQVATAVRISGEIEFITIDDPLDHWSAGTIVVGGQVVRIPRNLLIDLPANRLTLQEIYEQAPATCVAAAETGLAKADVCNTGGAGGFATIAANRTTAGNVIAGDVLIEKGREVVSGTVTFINYDQGYFRLNGTPPLPGGVGDDTTGVKVRLNDPAADGFTSGRHTIQSGPECLAGSSNCSPDPRFMLDSDNYTNVFSTGYPLCIPSTVARQFTEPAGYDVDADGFPGELLTAAANADGTGDLLCPTTNRPANPLVDRVADSRRFAPIMLGDSITAEGNFESINGVRFLSAHTTMVGTALATRLDANQPDYFFLDEVEIDAPGFQNQRARMLFIGFATLATPDPLVPANPPAPDVLVWSIHRDPQTNQAHEFPLGSVRGCDRAGGPATCGAQGLVGAGNNIFKINYDVDFATPTRERVNPCAHIRFDSRFATATLVCPGGTGGGNIHEQLAILSPMPHELMARSGKKVEDTLGQLITIDVKGELATNGEYLFPLGVNLGGVNFPEMVEIDLNALAAPISFTGLPWNLDRRLSPGGCIDTSAPPDGVADCETTPQPLDPFPFEANDPRTLTPNLPVSSYNDQVYTASTLSSVRDRMLSFVDGTVGNFNGNATVLALPPANPPFVAIAATPIALPSCAGGGTNVPVQAVADNANTVMDVTTTINVLANDTGSANPATVAIFGTATNGTATANLNGTVTFTPTPGVVGIATFDYTVLDRLGALSNVATVTVVIEGTPGVDSRPIALGDNAATDDLTPIDIPVLANDSDNGAAVDPLNPLVQVNLLTQPGTGTASLNPDKTVKYTPVAGFQGTANFTYSVFDGIFTSNAATVLVGVTRVNAAPQLTAMVNQIADIGTPVSIHGTATDSVGDVLTFSLPVAPAGMTIGPATGLIAWLPAVGQAGIHPVTVRVTDQGGLFAETSFTVTVRPDRVTVLLAQFRNTGRRWLVRGSTTAPGATITIFNSADLTGPILGTAVADVLGVWRFRLDNAVRGPNATRRISVRSNAGDTVLNVPVTVLQ